MKSPIIHSLLLVTLAMAAGVAAQTPPPAKPAAKPLGTMPEAAQFPKVEFVWEERVTLSPAVVLGKTAIGQRQYIPITGGTIDGRRLGLPVADGERLRLAQRRLFHPARRRHADPRIERIDELPARCRRRAQLHAR